MTGAGAHPPPGHEVDLLIGILTGIAGTLGVMYIFALFAFTFLSLGQTIRDLPGRILRSK